MTEMSAIGKPIVLEKFKTQDPLEANLRCAHGAPLLETLPAEDRASLRWPERNGGFLPALRAAGFGLCADGRGTSPDGFGAFGLTSLAALRLVLEALVGEKHLFAGSEHEFGSTLRALQNLVVVFHGSVPLDPRMGEGTRRLLHGGPRKQQGLPGSGSANKDELLISDSYYEPETLNTTNRGTGLGLLGLRARLCKLRSTVHYLTGA
jgi:hypothetical protein